MCAYLGTTLYDGAYLGAVSGFILLSHNNVRESRNPINSSNPGQNWQQNYKRFRQQKLVICNNFIIKVCSLGCNWWEVIVGLDNGLASNRWQAII